MLGQMKIEDILKRILSFSKAPATRVIVWAQDSYLTRFASNGIHQNVAENNVTVTVQAIDGKRIGLANTTDLSDAGLQKAAERALLHARQQPEDPDFPGLPDPKPIPAVAAVDEATADLSPDARAGGVKTVCDLAAASSLKAFGAFSSGLLEFGLADSQGALAYHPATYANLQTVIMGAAGTGWAQRSGWRVSDISAETVAQEAVEKARRAQNPRAIEPGKYTVILDPYAVSDLLAMLDTGGMGALPFQEGRSWMNERIGKQIMSPLISIWDDAQDTQGLPNPFDFEGVARQRVSIIEKGIAKGPVYDHKTATKDGKQSTGHALPPEGASAWGPLALNLFMAGGEASLEDMIRSTDKGLYVTRHWYTRSVHPRDCVITGMTRDGVTMIEKGELAYPVKDLRFTQSYVEALANVEAVGRDTQLLVDADGLILAARVPALKIGEFNYTGVTV